MSSAQSDFEDIRRLEREASLADRVTEQIERLIVERYFGPGSRLPSVRDLAERFGVSRTVIREAVRALAAKGLLEVSHGRSTIVRSPSAASVSRSMTLYLATQQPPIDNGKVLHVRRVLEIEIAGLAAAHRSDDDLAALEELLAAMSTHRDDPEAFARADVAFHAALARATGNELFSLVLDALADVLLTVRRSVLVQPGVSERGQLYHRAIFERVAARDIDGARQAMRAHLEEAEQTMREAITTRRYADSAGPANDEPGGDPDTRIQRRSQSM